MTRNILFAASVYTHRVADGGALKPLIQAACEGYRIASHESQEVLNSKDYESHTRAAAVNNEFFKWQMAFIRSTGHPWRGFACLPEFDRLVKEMRSAAGDFLMDYGHSKQDCERLSQQQPLVVWASVHTTESYHQAHIHSDGCVSGVYYASVPPGSGNLVFEDPRGRVPLVREPARAPPIPPFDQEWVLEPQEGTMVLFPSWLVHRVAPSGNIKHGAEISDGVPRVSFSFNLVGPWRATSQLALDDI